MQPIIPATNTNMNQIPNQIPNQDPQWKIQNRPNTNINNNNSSNSGLTILTSTNNSVPSTPVINIQPPYPTHNNLSVSP